MIILLTKLIFKGISFGKEKTKPLILRHEIQVQSYYYGYTCQYNTIWSSDWTIFILGVYDTFEF